MMKSIIIYYYLLTGLTGLFLFLPDYSYSRNFKENSVDLRKFINMSDIIAIGKVVSIGEDLKDGKGQAVFRISKVITGKPLGKLIYISFSLPKESNEDTVFKFGSKYLVFLDSGEGTEQVYDIAGKNFEKGIGLINEDEINITFTGDEINLIDYIAKIETHLNNKTFITKDRIDSIIDNVRKGNSVYGSRKNLRLAEIKKNSIKSIDDLRDIIHNSAVVHLKEYVSDESEDIRKAALYILSIIGSDDTADLMIQGLEDTRNSIVTKEICLKGLVKARSWKGVPALIGSFSKKVYKADMNNFNYNINQALWHIIIQRRYIKMDVDSPMIRNWIKIVEYEKLPNYRPYFDLGRDQIKAVLSWQRWQQRYYTHIKE